MADDETRELYAAMKPEDLAAELKSRGLPKTGTGDELVERLVAHDAETAAATAAPICSTCWPEGWPDKSASASCEHGDWLANPS